MQKQALVRHPDTPCEAVQRIEVEIATQGGMVQVRFRVLGDLARVQLPPTRAPQRQDELWRHTCCELFVGATESRGYVEFNLSPSSAWAAYSFSGYRAGMTPLEIPPPTIQVMARSDTLELIASIASNPFTALSGKRAALSCVIEETNGRVSYWALAHPDGKPDFHHARGFALELAE